MGLDLGSNSVGWAITDSEYNVLRKGKKALWGVRLFNESEGASARRYFRSARRRRKRAKQRTALLQEIFAPAISEYDPGFFTRMKDSFFIPSDKAIEQKYTLFNDKNYSDSHYHKSYPTIYHLRNELMESCDVHDARLVYLACHHIMRNRGHFHFDGESLSDGSQYINLVSNLWEEVKTLDEDVYDKVYEEKDRLSTAIEKTLIRKDLTNQDKLRELSDISDFFKSNKMMKAIFRLLLGFKTNLDDLFGDEENDMEIKSISFSDDYESKREGLSDSLGERISLIDACYDLYSWIILKFLLGDNSTISQAQIQKYELHKDHLRELKNLINRSIEDEIVTAEFKNRIFRHDDKKLNNYLSYVGHVSNSKDRRNSETSCNEEQFYDFIKKEIMALRSRVVDKQANDDNASLNELKASCDVILEDIKLGKYMPRIRSSSNGVIPHQLHANELKTILSNASTYLPFLTDEVRNKILKIFLFRIPYYVGPFDNRSEFSWIVRRNLKPITPMNFNEVVDEKATAMRFIERMTNKCSYLIGEDVLPKESLLYGEYLARNAINMLRIKGNPIDSHVRESMYEKLFQSKKTSGKVTRKRIISFLKTEGIVLEDNDLGGMDLEIPVKLNAYREFGRILSSQLSNREKDEIVLSLAALPDSETMIIEWLREKYYGKLSDTEINALSKLKFSGWGALSRKFLDEIRLTFADGTALTVIEIMRRTPKTLMEVLAIRDAESGKKLTEVIDHLNQQFQSSEKISQEVLDEYRLSPSVKKTVWQTYNVCNELFKVMKCKPSKIFIEMARSKEEKPKRTSSRKQKLLDLYLQCKNDARDWAKELGDYSDDELRGKKLYLYYMQKGRCMYSGDSIDIDKLFGNEYDIDHIYPRSRTKDDSFTNIVLVKSYYNSQKSDSYPLSDVIRQNQNPFWVELLTGGFLSQAKFDRLIRAAPLTENDYEGFINRQLVETRQVSKAVAQLLERFSDGSKVVYVKANNISDFRYNDGKQTDVETKFHFPKSRSINDFHHAKDAYLCIVVGNVYSTKFSGFFSNKNYQNNLRQYNLRKLYDYPVATKNNIAWVPGMTGSIQTVKKQMNRNDVLITHEVRRKTGGFFDQMLVPKGTGEGKAPIKGTDLRLNEISLYGSYNKVSGSHFAIIEHTRKNKRIRAIVTIPAYLAIYDDPVKLLNYLEVTGYKDVRILKNEIKYSGLVEINGCRYRLLAKTNNQMKCASTIQPYFSNNEEELYRKIEKESLSGVNSDINEMEIAGLFTSLVNRLGSKPYEYYSAFTNQHKILKKSFNSFHQLDRKSKISLIIQVLKLMQDRGYIVNFSALVDSSGKKLGTQSGAVQISMNVPMSSKIAVVHQSITGLYEQVEYLE